MNNFLANIVIPTHNRHAILNATLSSLRTFYGEDTKRFNVLIVDSSAEAGKPRPEDEHAWGKVVFLPVPGLHPYRKLRAADAAIDNACPVIYVTDDDLYGYSVGDLLAFARSNSHYSACRHLIFKTMTATNGQHFFQFWKGSDHVEKAQHSTALERLHLFCGQGLACFYGLFSREAFRIRAAASGAAMDEIGDGPSSSIIEDMSNLATQSLSWHVAPHSWCFRFYENTVYRSSPSSWQPSWIAIDRLRNDQPALLKRMCALLSQWINDNMQLSGDVASGSMSDDRSSELLVSHTEGYKGAHSRKWRSGKDFVYVPWESSNQIEFMLLPQEPYRPIFTVCRPVRLTEIDQLLFEGEWLTSEDARVLFNAMSDEFVKIRCALN